MKTNVIIGAILLIFCLSCRNKRYESERMNLLFGGEGQWYLQQFLVNDHDSLPGLLKLSTKQKSPISYNFVSPEKKEDKELGRFFSATDETFFELDKPVKSLQMTMSGLNCE